MKKVLLFLREIRVEHTLFALPFAYVGAVLAAAGLPSWWAIGWITLAVIGARTAAMAANRYFDRSIDARNPRTARRGVASGKLSPSTMLWAIAVGLVLLLWAAWELNPLCVKLLPVATIGLLVYPLCKRFTWLVHFVLGGVDALAPLGAYIGVAGRVTPPALLLFVAVTLWVAGFDVIYALMDFDVDRTQGLRSLPARFGERSGRAVPIALHVLALCCLAGTGLLAGVRPPYYAGVGGLAVLIVYEEYLLRCGANLFVINERVFLANMTFSVFFLATTLWTYA